MTQPVLAYRIAASVAALVLLAACGSDKKDTAAAATAPAVTTPAAAVSADAASAAPSGDSTSPSGGAADESGATAVDVGLSEYKLTLDNTTLAAGTYTFTATNNGKYPHALTIDGPGAADKSSGTIQPGDTGTVTVTLQKGTYDFYCPIPGHKDKGMDQKVTVTGS